MQAKKRQRRKYTRQQKVSIKTIKTIARTEAARLDKKKVFQNWNRKTQGSYTNGLGANLSEGKPVTSLGISNRPTHHYIGTGASAYDINFPRLHTQEQAGPDLLDELLHHRKSNKVYIDALQVKGLLRCPPGMDWEMVKFVLVECKISQKTVPTLSELGALVNDSIVVPPRSGYIKDSLSEIALDKNTRVVYSKTWTVTNPHGIDELMRPYDFTCRFKKPKLMQYSDDDAEGQLPLNRFFWYGWICYGFKDDGNGHASGDSPQVTGNVIVRYHEKLD